MLNALRFPHSFIRTFIHFIVVLFSGQRKSNAYLDVPSANFNHLQISDNDDEDVDRLRTFSSSKGGEYRPSSNILFRKLGHNSQTHR